MANQSPSRDGNPDDLLTVSEAADILKVSVVTLARWRRQGRLAAFKVGPRVVRIRRGDLDQLLAPQAQQALDHPHDSGDQRASSAQRTDSDSDSDSGGLTAEDTWALALSVEATDQRAAIAEAAALRAMILARRGGDPLPAPDAPTKSKGKKEKGKRK